MMDEPFRLERHFAVHEFTAKRLLSSSDCDAIALDDVIAGFDDDVAARWRALSLGYTESRGLPALRGEVAADYDGVSADDVLMVVPEEGILLSMWALVEPGTPVIVTAPAYQSLAEIARAHGARLHFWGPRRTAETLSFDVDDLAALIGDLSGLGGPSPVVVVNFPHNPTGAVLSEGEWRRVFSVVDDVGGRVFSDEMYRHLELGGRPPLTSAVELSPRAVTLSGLSKSLSAPGLRCGWLATRDAALRTRLEQRKDWTTICAPGPAELLSLAVLRRRRRIEADNRARVEENVVAARAAVAGRDGFTLYAPQGGSVALLDLGVDDAAPICEQLIAETGAMLVAASFFECGGDTRLRGCVRLGLGRASFAADFAATANRLHALAKG